MKSSIEPRITSDQQNDRLGWSVSPAPSSDGTLDALMLVLVAGADLEFCARVGASLQQDAHHVVMAADFDACRHFIGYARADAMIVSDSPGAEVPADLLREMCGRDGARVMVLTEEAGAPGSSRYLEAGAHCLAKSADPGDIVRWVDETP